jgi:tRNA (guanine-N7-)-methyltransferase
MRYVLPAREYESYPLNWGYTFQRPAPLAIEIGFGNGEYLAKWAALKPDWNFVGIDRSLGSVERLHKRIINGGLNNIRILYDDAVLALRELFEPSTVHHVVMNYPDPWPKDRHSDRRLLKPDFPEILAFAVLKDGLFELITDQHWLAENAFELFTESDYWISEKIEINPKRSVSTKYERKWNDLGRNSYRVCASKTKSAQINRFLENPSMPDLSVKKHIQPNMIFQLKGLNFSEGETFFIFEDIFINQSDNLYLIKTITKDSDYQQKFYVLIQGNNDKWLIKLDNASRPYRTKAVKRAIKKIEEILSSS